MRKLWMIALVAILTVSCQSGATKNQCSDKAKYVFFFIGDGMSATQIRLAEAALTTDEFKENYAKVTNSPEQIESLRLKSMGVTGLATTNALNRYITCSAAAATALATGNKTNIGIISQTPEGENIPTMAERAKAKGMKVGIVSSVSIDHATPACFYSHAPSRNHYKEISDQLLTSGFDYFAGGSVKWDSRAKMEETDKATAYASYLEAAKAKGYKYVGTRAEFDKLTSGGDSSVIASIDMLSSKQVTSGGCSLPYTIDLAYETNEDNRISLADFTEKGIELLDNENGFFMMVEGGKIDWACHANDAATCAYEVVAFDEAIGVALDFAKKHPDETLIVVTGDHDCGGLALGFAGTYYDSAFEVIADAKMSSTMFAEHVQKLIKEGKSFEVLLQEACDKLGFTNEVTDGSDGLMKMTSELTDFEIATLRDAYRKSKNEIKLTESDQYHATYSGGDPFTTACSRILNNKSGLDFSSFSHTAVPVMVFAEGACADTFQGYYDNTDVAKKIMEAAGI